MRGWCIVHWGEGNGVGKLTLEGVGGDEIEGAKAGLAVGESRTA